MLSSAAFSGLRREDAVSEERFRFVANESDIPEGKARCFAVDGHEVLVCHTREGFFAVHNICSHAYARLDEGRLRGNRIICPLHGASFDVRDGAVKGPPAFEPLATYELRVEAGRIEVALPA
jgi:3-phenylpropionate/trans-cinnamate dioxygenase ferredoxin subunit